MSGIERVRVVVAAVVVMLSVVALGAQDADTKALQQFRLTTDGLHKMEAVAQALSTTLASDASARKALEDAEDASSDNATLSDMAATFAKIPPVAAAIKAGGMTPREFAMFEMSMLQASMAAAMIKAGAVKSAPAEIAAENVKFVQDHEAEITRLAQQLQSGQQR